MAPSTCLETSRDAISSVMSLQDLHMTGQNKNSSFVMEEIPHCQIYVYILLFIWIWTTCRSGLDRWKQSWIDENKYLDIGQIDWAQSNSYLSSESLKWARVVCEMGSTRDNRTEENLISNLLTQSIFLIKIFLSCSSSGGK